MILIVGGPKHGKTTLATSLDTDFVSTDGLDMSQRFEEKLETVIGWVAARRNVEGVMLVHALRRILRAKKVDLKGTVIYYLHHPKEEQTKKQAALSKAVDTIMEEIRGGLRLAGATIKDVP